MVVILSLVDFHSLADEVAILIDHQKFDDLEKCVDDAKQTSDSGDTREDVGLVFFDLVVLV